MAGAYGPLRKVATILWSAWVLLGVVPVLAQMSGASFIASVDWTSKVSIIGIISGLGTALLALWIVSATEDDHPDTYVRRFALKACAGWFAYSIGNYAVVVAGPMVIALFAGHPISLSFTVSDTERIGSRWCREYVELQGLPFLFDRVCGVPSEFRDNLNPGTRVTVFGHGTGLGLFAKRLNRAS